MLLCYTTVIVGRSLKDAFEQKYPYVKVECHRNDSEAWTQWLLAEYQAERYDVDRRDGASTVVFKSVSIRSV